MNGMPPDVTLESIEKNRREQIRITLRSFPERPASSLSFLRLVDIRVHVNKHGEGYEPTAQGCAIRPEKLRQVIEALERAEILARKEGLI